jgi:hypothetical protein
VLRAPTRDQSLTLPPPFTAVRLREMGDAFAHAKEIAAESGAGTLVHVGRFDVAEFALVLEPEEPLRGARRALYAGMIALADALIGAAEPETAITISWLDAIRVNRGLVGGGRLAWPSGMSDPSTVDERRGAGRQTAYHHACRGRLCQRDGRPAR